MQQKETNKNSKLWIGKLFILFCYLSVHICFLFYMRRRFFLSSHQAVLIYAVFTVGSIALSLWSRLESKMETLKNLVFIVFSSFHGIIVMEFLSFGSFLLEIKHISMLTIANMILGFAVYAIFFLITGRLNGAVCCGNIFLGLVGILNHYLIIFRGNPFFFADFKSFNTARHVANNYSFRPDFVIVVGILDLCLWCVLWKWCLSEAKPVRRKSMCTVAIAAMLLLGCGGLFVLRDKVMEAQMQRFIVNQNYFAALMAEVIDHHTLPKDYSPDSVKQVIDRFQAEEWDGEKWDGAEWNVVENDGIITPNIVVIMNEAFSDLRVLGDLQTDTPFMPFWDAFRETTIHGYAISSVFGGNTANSEYEFLSCDSVGTMGIYSDTVPYNIYFDKEAFYPSIVSILKEQGYETTVFHPYIADGWNRPQVYGNMRFDRTVFLENIEEPLDMARNYISDRGDYSYVRKLLEEKEPGKPQFIFNITMQNHGGYSYDGENYEKTVSLAGEAAGVYPQTEQYLSLLRESDAALAELFDYFATYEEPLLVLVFGDHQPRLEEEFYEFITGSPMDAWEPEQKMSQYKTPFIIWNNYAPVEPLDLGNVSINYLSCILFQNTDLRMSDYQRYVLQQYQEIPVVNCVGLIDREGDFYRKGSEEYDELTKDYQLLIYNHTIDEENRIDTFFELNGE